MSTHYEQDNFASKYQSAFFYASSEYMAHVMNYTLHHFKLPQPDARIVDLGGGTGNFSHQLAVASESQHKVLCVEPFAEMIAKARELTSLECMMLDAMQFSRLSSTEISYTHVLLKEVIHHIPMEDLSSLFKGIHSQLLEEGILLIITRPQEVDYPLFTRARSIWKEHQPLYSDIASILEASSFSVSVHTHDYKAAIAKSTWLGMVRDRFWSTFSHCSDEELAAGIEELETQFSGVEELEFIDKLVFIVGTKM